MADAFGIYHKILKDLKHINWSKVAQYSSLAEPWIHNAVVTRGTRHFSYAKEKMFFLLQTNLYKIVKRIGLRVFWD